MIILLKIVLILIMVISFMEAIADGNKDLRTSMTAICIASILAAVTAFIFV